mgnify:FL=1
MSRPSVALYVISVAARSLGTHPQTLRSYERLGFVTPARSQGGIRLYSDDDLRLLARVIELSALGVGLTGIRMIVELEHEVVRLRAELERRTRR